MSRTYTDPAHWLCLPGRAGDPCSAVVRATELHADGTLAIEPDEPPRPHDDVDCFYVYPTVDMGLLPGNHEDFRDTGPMARTTIAQVGRFRDLCTMYVPLYRQVTIGTYLRSPATRDEFLAVAFSDVADAFLHYLAQYNHGHRIVLLGHSQGAEMVVRLLQRFFDADPAMRARLVVALAIGGNVDTAPGASVGGTFANLPLCAHDDDRGCVVAYRSYRQGDEVHPGRSGPPAGRTSACVNPAHVGSDAAAPFARTYLPLGEHLHVDGVTTPFVMMRNAYVGQCVVGADGYRYLAVTPPEGAGDARATVLHWRDGVFGTVLGLHILDYQLPQGDLVDLVARRIAAGAP